MEKELSSAQKTFLKDVVGQEKRLRSLKNETITHAAEISELQKDLREKFQKLIIQHPSFGSFVVCKEMEEKLWKLCFYVKIEEYRKSIRKTVLLRDSDEVPAANPGESSRVMKAKTHLAKLISAFSKFLSDGTSFYQEFMSKLEESYKTHHVGLQNSSTADLKENFVQCTFSCLMYLGDLARYRELYRDCKEKDYIEAERYYERASFLFNSSGHPHNQLAVLSSYTDMDYLAVYHYCRSVMIPKPFVSGCDNLSMIFEKNLRTFASLRDDSPDTRVDGQEGSTADRSKKQSLAARAHSFFIRFIRLHGDLFKWTLNTSRAITDLQKSSGNGSGSGSGSAAERLEPYVAERFDVSKCMSLIHKVLSDFEFFMRYDESSVFSEMLLVKLLAIALFSVHHTASIFGERTASDPLDNSISESLALYFLFNFISRCATLLAMIPSSGSKMVESNVRRVLPVLTVFADWCCLHPRYLGCSSLGRDGKSNKRGKVSEGSRGSDKDRDEREWAIDAESVCASEELMRSEEEALSSMKSCVTFLESFVKASMNSQAGCGFHSNGRGSKHQEQRPPLKEDIELRGFLPFKKSNNVWFCDLKGLGVALPTAVPDEMARNRRLRDLAAFIEKVKAAPRSPVLRPRPSSVLSGVLDAERGARDINGKQGRREDSHKAGDKRDPRAGLLAVSQGVISFAKMKEKEREKSIEKFYNKMGDLRDRIDEEEELEDQNGKKGRREESAVGDGYKREQRAGLLTVAPGVLTAAKQKEKERERNVERTLKIRGERRPGGRLVDTRTSGGRVTAREKERERNKEREREREIRSSNKSQADVQVMKGTEADSSTPTRRQQVRRSNGDKEDFPPLPGAREPHSHGATLNYAASALFTPAAPVDMDPFDNDSTSEDEYDEDAFTEDGDLDTDEDEAGLDAFYVGDAEEVEVGEPYGGAASWALDTAHMGTGLGPNCAIHSPAAMQSSSVTASGVFGGLFSNVRSGSAESLFAGYGDSMEESMADLMPTISITQSAPYEDDDADDDVVVFRPAFSRINAGPSSNQPPPLSYIGDSPTPPLQPYLPNSRTATSGPADMVGVSSHSHRRSGPFGLSGSLNPYDDRFESNLSGMRGPESTWHHWDRSSTPTLSCVPDEGGYAPIPMGSMVFNESSSYSGMTDPLRDNNSPRNLCATDAWWAKQSSSDVVNNMPNLFSVQSNGLGEPEYVSARGTRGPPALQLVPSGWAKQGALPPPAHPPGLVPPPPGFSTVSNNQGGPIKSFQQQGQGQGQRDGAGGPWTANPFYRSSG